jgi:glucose/arabinose dehydrogenase
MEPEQQNTLPDNQNEQNQLEPQIFVHKSPRKKWVTILLILLLILGGAAGLFWWQSSRNTVTAPSSNTNGGTKKTAQSTEAPELSTQTILEGRERVWDIAFLPTKELIFSERSGTLSMLKDGEAKTIQKISDVKALGEGGLLGIAVDPKFSTNRYIYTCFNTEQDIRIVRWALKADMSGLEQRKDIVTGVPRNSGGRHSGCRMAFGQDGYLWIGTGDTAQNITPQTPQDPKSLAGKILHVDRDGQGAPGNLGGNFDARIYSYGHRNTQGIAFFDTAIKGVPGISAEHGTSVDDEVNLLKPGNFGWAPPDGPYDESVSMTDKDRFPDAIDSVWSSGDPTQAPSGAAVLNGSQWKVWDGAVVVAMLKGQHLKVLQLDSDLKVTKETQLFKDEFLRLRAVVQGPDGSLYMSTDNGTNDKIIRVTPQ